MSANELLHLTDAVLPVLEALLKAAEDDKYLQGQINKSAQQLILQLRKLSQDEALKQEILNRADIAREGLRFIARRSCENYESLGGFDQPKAAEEVTA